MTNKTSFSADESAISIPKYAVFDRIVNEIDPEQIPAKYIDRLRVTYQDGSVVMLSGSELACPLPTTNHPVPEVIERFYRQMREVKLFINNVVLETDVTRMVEDILGDYC